MTETLMWMITEFLKIGVLGFGGGLAILPMIFQSVAEYGHMTAEDFADLVGISQVTPGPIAINAATFVGFNEGGITGALAATVAVVLPGLVLMVIAIHFLEKFKESRVVQGIFKGIRPVTCGLIFTAMVYVAEGTLWDAGDISSLNLIPCIIFALTLLLAGKFRLNPILIICLMGAAGALAYGYF